MDFSNIFIVIPCFNPTDKLIKLIKEIQEKGFSNIILINDGSSSTLQNYFNEAKNNNCVVLNHSQNFGKGQSLKTGIKYIIDNYNSEKIQGILTVDSDYQYSCDDVLTIAETMIQNPNSFIMGLRNFSNTKLPLKTKIRHKLSQAFFKLSTGKKCSDTQCGLRGIPKQLFNLAIEESGKRYDYEMNFLMDAVLITETIYVPIESKIISKDKISYYHAFSDTIRVFARFLTFIGSSMFAYVLDFSLFSILGTIIFPKFISNEDLIIWISTAAGKAAAGVINFTINKKYSFKTKNKSISEFLKYVVVFFIKFGGSAELVTLLKFIPIPLPLLKCIIDTLIFFISYRLQKVWVFKKKIGKNK